MGLYYTKRELYDQIHRYKNSLGLSTDDYAFDIIDCCMSNGVKVEKIPFISKGLRGMAAVGTNGEEDIILLNSKRSFIEQNLDCGHEIIHIGIHRNLKQKTFNCIDGVAANQDPFTEWQANEGAAELLIPYHVLLPLIRDNLDTSSLTSIYYFKNLASYLFNVTRTVIEYRLESLKFEINQYLGGVPLDHIQILSAAQQQKMGIRIKPINAIERELYSKKYGDWYIGPYYQ